MKEKALEKIIERAAVIWAANPEELNETTLFASFNPKSAHIAQLTTFLEDAFDIEVPYMKFKRCATFGDAADFIVELSEE